MIYDTNNLRIHHRTQATMSLLESFERISREFTRPSPYTTPLVEAVNYGGTYMVRYSDLIKLCEEYEISVQEAINEVVETHQLQPHEVIVSLEEWRAYDDPYILYRFSNEYVVVPEYNTPTYQFCEDCMNLYLETGDESYIDFYINAPPSILNEYTEDQFQKMISALAKANPKLSMDQLKASAEKQLQALDKLDPIRRQQAQREKEELADRQERLRAIELDREKRERIEAAKKAKEEWDKTHPATEPEPSSNTQPSEEQGWFSRKLAAFKNWWNNAGQQKEGEGGGWFSNLIGKIKSGLGLGNFKASPASTAPTPSAAATNPTPANPAQTSEQKAAQAAQTAEKKQDQKVDNRPPAQGTPATVQNQKTT